ncbi:type II secretion system F family protein [Alienimonas chondri]|uniref:type II secretion system F family protein n=1 Tax=Alienimonas chondri TaxID=2681879 RepID=UPI001488AD62|nr:type II secretion system F family protein [Alienimonas chondri]
MSLIAIATAWALVRRGRRLRAASLLGELAVAARRRLPLDEELEELSDTLLRGDRVRANRAASALREGIDLQTALREARLIPPSSEPALAAGEASGALPRTLSDEADRLRGQAGGAAAAFWNVGFYLLVTLCAIQAVLGFILYYIVPKYKKIFEDFGMSPDGFIGESRQYRTMSEGWLAPPWFEGLLGVGSLWVKYFYLPFFLLSLIALGLPLLAVASQKGLRLPGGGWRRRWFGRKRAHASRVARALANAAEAKRPFPETLTAYAAAADTRSPALRKLARNVEQGGDVWPALHRAGLFTAGEARLAETGTAAGNLPRVLRLIADRLDVAADRRRGRWLALLHPAATLFIGMLVAWVALAFFTPLVRLLHDLG